MKKKRRDRTTPLFLQLKLLKFTDICKLNTALFVFKSVNNLVTSPIHFQFRHHGPYNIRNREPLSVPLVRSNQSRRAIGVRGAELWNHLEDLIRSSRTILGFKRKIKNSLISMYSVP